MDRGWEARRVRPSTRILARAPDRARDRCDYRSNFWFVERRLESRSRGHRSWLAALAGRAAEGGAASISGRDEMDAVRGCERWVDALCADLPVVLESPNPDSVPTRNRRFSGEYRIYARRNQPAGMRDSRPGRGTRRGDR